MKNQFPTDLVTAIQSQILIPVVGAGVSMSLVDDEGNRLFPSWKELLNHAADELRENGKEKLADAIHISLDLEEFQRAAEYARRGLQGTLWSKFFKKNFEDPLAEIAEGSKALPKAVWGLGNRVLTLNYDKVLRATCPDSERLNVLDNGNSSELAGFGRGDLGNPALWHFHGRVDNQTSIIFTTESYDTLYAGNNAHYAVALATFKGLCINHRLLFVGCSLEDAELLEKMAEQHELFGDNTGPHYALVHQDVHDDIQKKIGSYPIILLPFDDFGDPLVNLVNALASYAPSQKDIDVGLNLPQGEKAPEPVKEVGAKIALLVANPLNDELEYTGIIKQFKKLAYPIDQFSLSIDNLNQLAGYDYLLILSKVVKNKLMVEDDHLCSSRISFEELEEQIGNESTSGLFIFVDQFPVAVSTEELRLPTLILAELEKKQLSSVAYKLFRKNDLESFSNQRLLNYDRFRMAPLSNRLKGHINKRQTPLPKSIDPKTLRNFIGRNDDLESICRKLMALEDEGGLLNVKGAGGIGKTTTVKKIAVALAERGYFDGGIAFVDCEPITDSQQFEYKVAEVFGLEQAEDLEEHLQDHHDHRSRLILVDNFETLLYLDDHQEIKTLMGMICDYSTVVVTSRERLGIEGESVYDMRQFTTDEAVELFVAGLDQREILPNELNLLRQDIIENLLDNNPLAIKLITGNMPKGKSLSALKEELETDLFSKVSDMDLEVFDSSSDLNIAKKKSIYCSILYSYIHLSENEKKAFELLSLFPDGIDMEAFKRLTSDRGNTSNSAKEGLKQAMISDKVIKALDNKSMIESNGSNIKLQSIVGKFADAQFRKRENRTLYYRNAFEYNHALMRALEGIRDDRRRLSLEIVNEHQGNLLKCMTYCGEANVDNEELCDYLDSLAVFLTYICSLKSFIQELSRIVKNFEGRERACVDMILLSARYFDGDFDRAFFDLKRAVKLEELALLDRNKGSECILAGLAFNIYMMEGELLTVALYRSEHRLGNSNYEHVFLYLGEFNQELMTRSSDNFFKLEVMGNMGLLSCGSIDAYLSGLYDKTHLERMQSSYTRSKLCPLERKQVETLVVVNPYTRGLKGLMLAFVEPDIVAADALYRESIEHLSHIKYYYVEALYYYSAFLQRHNMPEFEVRYQQGFALAKKHHYRFLQYRFEQLLDPTGISYEPQNYPLPDGVDFTAYIQFLIKENKRRK
ncbi:SIR2 family protein [Pontiellaceae bacterium B1224]|nr:SIR2 family protein [Pontiellaceae bacterium B1224]